MKLLTRVIAPLCCVFLTAQSAFATDPGENGALRQEPTLPIIAESLLENTLFASPTERSGGVDGGGANAIVCYKGETTEANIASVRLLDLVEASIVYGRTIPSGEDNVQKQLKRAFAKISEAGPPNSGPRPTLYDQSQILFATFRFLPDGYRLKPIDDSKHDFIPDGCRVEQLAVQRSQYVLVDNFLWQHLTATDQAAVIAHETLYQEEIGIADNSRRVRAVVGAIFSDAAPFPDVLAGIPNRHLFCQAFGWGDDGKNTTNLYVYMDENESTIAQFVTLGGVPVYAKTTFVLQSRPHYDREPDYYYKLLQKRGDWNFLRSRFSSITESTLLAGDRISFDFQQIRNVRDDAIETNRFVRFGTKSVWNGIETADLELHCFERTEE